MSARNVQPAPLLQRAGAMLAHVLRLDWREAVPALFGLAATLVLAMAWLLGSSPSLGAYLGDTDDALRLVTVRELLAGAPWFDTTLPRVGAPDVLVSHWSRLIDLPLAVLVTAFTPLVGAARAEIVVRAIWPLLLFLPLAILIVHEARRRAESTGRAADGLWAAGAATVLMLMSVTALGQFAPGRIDHHNAQILCAVGGLLLLVRSWHEPRLGWWSGVLLGLGLAIGYEAIALTAAGLGLAGVAAVAWPDRGEGVLRAATGASAALLIAFLATVSPAYWLDVRCDALSLNLPTLALCCTVGLAIALRQPGGLVLRLAIAGAGAAIGGLAYATLEPACLAGPFGQVTPALGPIWLDKVIETKSLLWLGRHDPAAALAFFAFVAAGCAAQVALWRRQRDGETGLLTSFVVLAALLACWQQKLMPYAAWLAVVPVAVWAAGLRDTRLLSATVLRIGAVVLVSQATLDTAFGRALAPRHGPGGASLGRIERADPQRACLQSASVARLTALPPGLIAGDIDLGPYVVALTPHRVVAAPYHRLETGIIANHVILAGAPAQAAYELRRLGVDYLALCAAPSGSGRNLRARLLDGQRFDFLREVDLGQGAPMRVWRVVP